MKTYVYTPAGSSIEHAPYECYKTDLAPFDHASRVAVDWQNPSLLPRILLVAATWTLPGILGGLMVGLIGAVNLSCEVTGFVGGFVAALFGGCLEASQDSDAA